MNKRERRGKKVPVLHDVYLSGPISSYGTFDENIAAFAEGARQLRDLGFTVFSPPEFEERGWTWAEYLRADIVELVMCRMLVLLPNWEKSKGATLEADLAGQLGMPVLTLDEVLKKGLKPR